MDHSTMDHSKINHAAMNHGGMDHGNMGHGGMHMGACSMNMYLNADIDNLCILTERWHVTGVWSLLQSCIVIVLFAMLFEFLRERIRRYEANQEYLQLETTSAGAERAPRSVRATRKQTMIKAMLYAFQVDVSYTLMLVFMTFNVYVMAAVTIGAGLGHYFFNTDPASIGSKSMACH